LLAESGYLGQPITFIAAQDIPLLKAWGDVAVDLFQRLGINVDFVATDWGTQIARVAQKSRGWHMYVVWAPGAGYTDPTGNYIRATGADGFSGWPSSPQVEAEIAAWLEAKTPEEEKAAAQRLNKAALDHVLHVPLGFFLRHQAWRKNVS